MTGSSQTQLARPRRFQFSLAVLLASTAIVACVMGLWLASRRRAEYQSRPSRFSQAIQRGDLREVDRLLKLEPQLAQGRRSGSYSSSHTPLQLALIFGSSPAVVERILKERPDLNEKSQAGDTALHLMVGHRKQAYVARLLQLGADPNVMNRDGQTPLHSVTMFDSDGQLTKLLLDGGADPNTAQEGNSQAHYARQGMRPLHLAIEARNSAAVKLLLAAGADVNARDALRRTPLHLAMGADLDTCRNLVARGADLTAKDEAGRIPGEPGAGTSSDDAGRRNQSENAAVIWWERVVECHDQKRIAELNKQLDAAPQALSFRRGYTPDSLLDRAIAADRMDVLSYLLSRRKQLQQDDLDNALHTACSGHVAKSMEFAKKLLDAGVSVDAKSDAWYAARRTPLHTAATFHNRAAIELLIAKGANIEARDKAGTSVMDAAFENRFHLPDDLKTLELLVKAGHPPTMLYAAATGDVALLRKLTGDGSESLSGLLDKAYTTSGMRPLHAAVLGNQPAVAEWLLAHGASCDPALSGPWGYACDTPLMVALSGDKVGLAILFIEHGADVNHKDRHGYYPVHAVVTWDRDPKILEALLTHGADVTLKYENKTVLELAQASRSRHRARYLELLKINRGKQVAAGQALP